MEGLTIRDARPDDASGLSIFATRVFQETFARANEPENMRKHLASVFSTAKQEREISDPAIATLLAEVGGVLAGYAQLIAGEVPATVKTPLPIALMRFYVDAPWQGRGLAHDLMFAVLERAASRGARSVWLAVWERNPRAIFFYQKEGFIDAGSHPFMLGSEIQLDRVMVRVIAASR
jgi:ribosomal protein S18 acetylase RimI-like enzyme